MVRGLLASLDASDSDSDTPAVVSKPISKKGAAKKASSSSIVGRAAPVPSSSPQLSGYESDNLMASVQAMVAKHQAKKKRDIKVMQQRAAEERSTALKQAEDQMKAAKANYEAEWKSLTAEASKTIAAEQKRARKASEAFETSLAQLQGDIRGALQQADEDDKAAAKESKELESVRERLLAAHHKANAEIIQRAHDEVDDLLTKQTKFGDVCKAIGELTRQLVADQQGGAKAKHSPIGKSPARKGGRGSAARMGGPAPTMQRARGAAVKAK